MRYMSIVLFIKVKKYLTHKMQQLLEKVLQKHILYHAKTFMKLLGENKAGYKKEHLVHIMYGYKVGRHIG